MAGNPIDKWCLTCEIGPLSIEQRNSLMPALQAMEGVMSFRGCARLFHRSEVARVARVAAAAVAFLCLVYLSSLYGQVGCRVACDETKCSNTFDTNGGQIHVEYEELCIYDYMSKAGDPTKTFGALDKANQVRSTTNPGRICDAKIGGKPPVQIVYPGVNNSPCPGTGAWTSNKCASKCVAKGGGGT